MTPRLPRSLEHQFPPYQCHKVVRAAQIAAIEPRVGEFKSEVILTFEPVRGRSLLPITVPKSWIERHAARDLVGGYFVLYEDGYMSWSPAAAFENGYAAVELQGLLDHPTADAAAHRELLRFLCAQVGALRMDIKGVQDKITKLTADVAAETTVEQSAVTLLNGLSSAISDLKQQLADAIASKDTRDLDAVAASLDALDQSVSSATGDLAAAVTANTPSASAPPAPTPTPGS